MTAWHEGTPDDRSLSSNIVAGDLVEAMAQGALLDESITLITGLASLAGLLLMGLERQTGRTVPEILQRIARRAAQGA